MTLNEVLNSRNIDNEIYLCDIRAWLNEDMTYKQVCEIRDKLQELWQR